MKLKEMILSKLKGEELGQIVDEHMRLSIALGYNVGIHENSDKEYIEKKRCIVDEVGIIKDKIVRIDID